MRIIGGLATEAIMTPPIAAKKSTVGISMGKQNQFICKRIGWFCPFLCRLVT